MEKIAIYGAGDQGRLVAWTIEALNEVENRFELVCFIDDDTDLQNKYLNEVPIRGFDKAIADHKNLKVVSAVGNPSVRKRLMEKVSRHGLETETLIYPNVQKTRWVEVEKGSVIGAGCIISSNVHIGFHVYISFDCTIGHDARIEDYVTISPGVHLAGNVHIRKRAFLGLGAVVVNGTKDTPLVIGRDALVGAGACVTKSVPPGTTVVGVPARPIGSIE